MDRAAILSRSIYLGKNGNFLWRRLDRAAIEIFYSEEFLKMIMAIRSE
jgi:hypothetical protein